MSRKVGLRTRDPAGNVLLDTPTAMFRLIGAQTVRVAWRPNFSSYWPQDAHDITGGFTNPALALGEPFFFYRPTSFGESDPLNPTATNRLVFTVDGTTASWEWEFSNLVTTTPVYIDISFGVRS